MLEALPAEAVVVVEDLAVAVEVAVEDSAVIAAVEVVAVVVVEVCSSPHQIDVAAMVSGNVETDV